MSVKEHAVLGAIAARLLRSDDLSMGADPRASSTEPRGAHHQLRGLWVADGSLFPTSIGVPPQISVYAFARALAAHVAEGHG